MHIYQGVMLRSSKHVGRPLRATLRRAQGDGPLFLAKTKKATCFTQMAFHIVKKLLFKVFEIFTDEFGVSA
ncbi:hypothetical protein ABIC45_003841 [Mucilaginibacter rubeus]